MPAGALLIIGINSCLQGENVRYDGQNKYTGISLKHSAHTWISCRCALRQQSVLASPGQR